jgi:hypothetical protein
VVLFWPKATLNIRLVQRRKESRLRYYGAATHSPFLCLFKDYIPINRWRILKAQAYLLMLRAVRVIPNLILDAIVVNVLLIFTMTLLWWAL